MPDDTEASPLESARAAAAEGDWQTACDLLIEADAAAPLTGADLPLLAGVAYAAGRLDVTIDSWERAYRDGLRAGDHVAAAGAAVRIAMHLMFDTALLAPVRAWLTRAERLLASHEGTTAVHAWLAVVRSYDRLLSGDFDGARQWARRAIDAGVTHDPAAAALGSVAEARALILQGDTTEGLRLLNEAAVATMAGEIDPLSTGVVYCEVVCAFQALGHYDLAEEWTAAMERWRHGKPVGSVHGRCRIHRAEILRLRGACAEAESEILMACEELRPYLRREFGWPLTELGRIRLRMGDTDGAEHAFRAAQEAGWDPQPGIALVHLRRGDAPRAAASIRDALDHPSALPSKEWPPNTALRRAPLLEAQVEIEIAAGDLGRARSAAGELERVAAMFQSKALAATAALARARVTLATGDAAEAGREFQKAAQQWSDIGAPYETALAHTGFADALRAQRNEEESEPDVRTAPEQARSVDAVFRREGDSWFIAFDGRTARLRDARGLQYLGRLLGSPGRELHVLDLVAAPSSPGGAAAADAGDAGELLDGRAKAAYRRRLAEIEEDIDDARSAGDDRRQAEAEGEREYLMRELARAVGLGGRDRRAGSASERARSAVTRAIRQAMIRIRKQSPSFAEHLDRTIRTGIYCAYLPESRRPVAWEL